ncbi:hypothetical protein BD779DRAFT_1518731 [Infundibulicybe gibba]|nr:hypothetical protein BD779DRAFT_1518731 [Infundibulicybe gibba]
METNGGIGPPPLESREHLLGNKTDLSHAQEIRILPYIGTCLTNSLFFMTALVLSNNPPQSTWAGFQCHLRFDWVSAFRRLLVRGSSSHRMVTCSSVQPCNIYPSSSSQHLRNMAARMFAGGRVRSAFGYARQRWGDNFITPGYKVGITQSLELQEAKRVAACAQDLHSRLP